MSKIRLFVFFDQGKNTVRGYCQAGSENYTFSANLRPTSTRFLIKSSEKDISEHAYQQIKAGWEQLIPVVCFSAKRHVSLKDVCNLIVADLRHDQPFSRLSGQQVVENTLKRLAEGACTYGDFIKNDWAPPGKRVTHPAISPTVSWAF
jgi:hypothetical protein